MRNRADFMENLKQAHIHLMILVEDIKYPLPEERQKLLNAAYMIIGHLSNMEMQDDMKDTIKILNKESEVKK